MPQKPDPDPNNLPLSPSGTPPVPGAVLLLDAATLDRILRRIGHEIIERNADLERVALVGIPSRGVELARRIAAHIEQFEGRPIRCGVIDVTMHRDDLRLRQGVPRVESTHLPEPLEGSTLILVDDVLFSGRTCRAALEAIASFGRPARIQYAVLIDRGHRELPIRADYIGKNIPTTQSGRVFVRLQAVDEVPDAVWVTHATPPPTP